MVQLLTPADGTVVEGPTNLTVSAQATAAAGITNVQFLSNGGLIGNDPSSPYSIGWDAPFGSNRVTAVAYDAQGKTATSAVANVVITIPPTNSVAPTVASVNPARGATIGGLTTIQITFSEDVLGVNSSDLLVNGSRAQTVSGIGSNYIFTVNPPGYGTVSVTWSPSHGIHDIGFPSSLPFDATGPGATWDYQIVDLVPPVVSSLDPTAGATVTNLNQIDVTFSKPVTGVDASDLLVNGTGAIGLTGSGTDYTFAFPQPASGTVRLSWANGHGIQDTASPPNAFDGSGFWTYTLDARTILVQTNSDWRLLKGTAEASSPIDAWRLLSFDDNAWTPSAAPFFYGDPYGTPADPGTQLNDMQGNYSTIYLRKMFVVPNVSAVTNLFLDAQSDDGFIAWINGVEVTRFNVFPGDLPYDATAAGAVNEPNNNGAAFELYTLPDPTTYLVEGTNVLAVHAFNQSLTQSSDFGFNAQLFTYLADPSIAAPRIFSVTPSPGSVFSLTNLTITFTELVSGVSAGDLLINGNPATGVSGGTDTNVYTFQFAQPAFGPVTVTWATGHGIADFDSPPKPFDENAPGSSLQFNLLNPSAPTVALQAPAAGATISELSQITVTFSEPVTGVGASDLLINGSAASAVSGSGAIYTFTFAQPAYGPVSVGWAANHGIQDLESPANAFDASRPGSHWGYDLVDQEPPAIASQNPTAGSQVTNLTQITVTFTEPVTGVDARDFLVNGLPATTVTGTNDTYTFTFPQPNATTVQVTWAVDHGITDLAANPNSFDIAAPSATWSYTTPDTVAPTVANIEPAAFVTVRSLTQVRVTFTEPVTGLGTNDLLINGQPARQLAGSGAGPYTFSFAQPANGTVEIRWAAGHNITDLASPPNGFGGGEWTYILDPNASFAGKVLISEIMFDPISGQPADEWIELHNIAPDLVNLAGWSFTRGVNFTFPNVAIPAGGYLVVAADLAAFQAKYPSVTNVVGGWTGKLANSDETLELTTALGETVNRMHYASEGDWARRERGNGASLVTSIVRNGGTATVTVFNHGYTRNDQVVISGADQPEYNGQFTLNQNTGVSTFDINVPGSPASPATGNIIARLVTDNGVVGWAWFSAASGFGSSLELVDTALPNDAGQNWLASTTLNGTPGRANSVLSTNTAPLVLDVTHFPPVPRSIDPVAITARVQDEQSNAVQSVTLFYRSHTTSSPGAFLTAQMFDDGQHRDGVAGDGLYGAVLPSTPNGTVVEFYVQATDQFGLSRTWPAPAWDGDTPVGQLANALYQVDNEVISNPMPSIRLVLSGTEDAIFPPGNRNTDAEMNATMITMDGDGTKVRYNTGVRVRGAGTRSRTPPNNRVDIPNDNRWNGLSAINLNSQFVHAQLVGNVVAQKSGLPATDAHVVQYRINGVNPAPITAPNNFSGNGAGYGTFLLLEPVNGDLTADLFPLDPDGNLYRASTGNHNANLDYQGTNPDSYLSRGYYKTSNRSENDWTDLFNLTFAFSQVPDADFTEALGTNVNVLAWMRYFAVGTLMNYGETALFNGIGDDYALYRGENDPRFVLLGHDFDTIFGQGDTGPNYYPININASIFVMLNPPNPNANVPLLRRLMTNQVFAPLYYAELKRLTDTTFSPAELDPLIDQLLSNWGSGPSAQTIADMKNYAANRRAVVLSQIPLNLTIEHSLSPQNGYLHTSSANVTLSGTSHAIDTRQVLVNGKAANWSAWEARWNANLTLQPGLNTVLVQSLNAANTEFERATLEIWYDDGSTQDVSGTIASDAAWNAAGGPYNVTGNLTIASGATLTIQPGTTVYLGSGVNVTVANGGRILAEGTETAPIRFTRAPGTATTWGGMTINGGANSPETRLAYARFEFNNSTAIHSSSGTLFLDHVSFGATDHQYVSLDSSSFVIRDCVFPSATALFELVHGTGGIKSGGRGIFARNFFGMALSQSGNYNDVLDFTGGNRPGPIVQLIDNVFIGASDDHLDLDSTDAWIEGNIFLHAHKNGSPDTASGVSGGADNADTSEITIIGNIFYDCDQAAMAKQGNFYTLINNTIVHQTHQGGLDTDGAVVALADEGTVEGAGMYLEGNIIFDAEKLVRNLTAATVTFTNNLMPFPWTGPGGDNAIGDPLFQHVPDLAETVFTNWAQAQVMKEWLSLQPGSPAQNAGPNGQDLGGVIPIGASVSGIPDSPTSQTSATLSIGVNRKGSGIPSAGWPNGSGYTAYKWRLDAGPWSQETPIQTPLSLNGLAAGTHRIEISGLRDSGFYQDDPVYGSDAVVTVGRAWTVQPGASPLRLNEILAANSSLDHEGSTPDLVELYNEGDAALGLAGLRLTDDPRDPDKFIFPAGASIPAHSYLVVYANNPDGTSGYHLGFNLNQQGDALYLYDDAGNGGALLDSVRFGLQLTDLSIGRMDDGSWALAAPTFGDANRAAPTGDPAALRINEWLAISQTPFANDFIELYNSDTLPVAMGGLFLSDEIIGWKDRHQIAPLSFIAGLGYQRFVADADPQQGPDHLNFSLSGDQGNIGLFFPDLSQIDCIHYEPQRVNVSEGRSPNGGSAIVFFDQPTPGAPNPAVTGPPPFGGALVLNEVLALNASLAETNGRTPDWVEIYNGTTSAIDLADLSLTDDPTVPRRFVFASGSMIAPAGYLLVLFDSGADASTNNTGFGLKATGGSVYLFDAQTSGGGLLDAVTYGLQTADLSIGRIPDGGTNWILNSPTPGAANSGLTSLANPATLRVNEWMADPASGDDWFEIYNPNTQPVALGGLYLTDDLNDPTKHRVPDLSFLGAGTNAWQLFHADGNVGAGADHVSFSLRAAGEAIGLFDTNGVPIDAVSFGPQDVGVSEGRFPDGSTNVISFPGTDSPGASNYRQLLDVAINEVLTHTDEPLEDAIELVNLTSQPIDVGGWWLSDDKSTLQKYQIPSPTVLPAHGFTVIYENAFTNRNLAAQPFALSSKGDETVLSPSTNGALTGFRATVKFGAAENAVSFGRYLTSDGREEFVALSARTFGMDDPGSVEEFRLGTGATNAYPKVGPVVISEIMYHPPDLTTNDNTRDEFIELHNITTSPVQLFDPAHSTNAWHIRDAVDFNFPAGTSISAGGYLLVVSFDPVNNTAALEAFRDAYHLSTNVPVVGPYSGKLANSSDQIELRKPDLPTTNDVPYVLVEQITYSDTAPWPAEADGTGFSLQRNDDQAFGDDPINWTAAAPNPGQEGSNQDSDGDGIPDAWENLYGLDPFNALDAALDSDGDGLSNLAEYELGTNPRDPQSGLRFTAIALAPSGTNLVLSFTAVANQTYSIESSDSLGGNSWQSVEDIASAPTNRLMQISVPMSSPMRFYRLRTPWRLSDGSGLRVMSIQPLTGNQVSLLINAPANQACTLSFSPEIANASWNAVTNFPAATTNQLIHVITAAPGARGFYRLSSP